MTELITKDSSVTEWNDEQWNIVRNTLAPTLSDDELMVYAHMCRRMKLDPIAKQLYAIKRGGRVTFQTGIDGFRLIAERTGKYAPGRDTEFLFDKDGKLVGAKVFVKKWVRDQWHEVSATAFLHEYSTNQNLWKSMPSVMIEKCAECRALRRAFPADFSGVYGDDEMEQADAQITDRKPPGPPKIYLNEQQQAHIRALCTQVPGIEDKLLRLAQKTSWADIEASKYNSVITYINKQREKMNAETGNEP